MAFFTVFLSKYHRDRVGEGRSDLCIVWHLSKKNLERKLRIQKTRAVTDKKPLKLEAVFPILI